MSLWCSVAFALAQPGGVDGMANRMGGGLHGDRAQFDPGRLLVVGLVVAVIVLAIWLIWYYSNARRRPAAYNSPRKLFLALCRAHRLRWRDAWLLWRVARWHELEDPTRLFLDPERFDPQGLNRLLARHATRLRWLRRRLFAGLPEGGPQPDPPTNSGIFELPVPVTGTTGNPPPVDAIA